jgi:hypothetical protein
MIRAQTTRLFRRAHSIQPALILSLVCLMTGGCVRSVYPILKDDQLISDKSVLGKWVSTAGTESINVQPAEQENTLNVLYTEENGRKANLEARLGKIGDLTIAEFHTADLGTDVSDVYKTHLLPLYSFIVIQQSAPQLVFSMIQSKDDHFKKLVAQHPEELKVLQKDESVVTSPTDDFQAFLLRHIKDEGFLSDKVIWVRPGDPTTQPAAPQK